MSFFLKYVLILGRSSKENNGQTKHRTAGSLSLLYRNGMEVQHTHPVLRRQGYKILILKKDLVFYKFDELNKKVIIYAVADQQQDYLNIIRGL